MHAHNSIICTISIFLLLFLAVLSMLLALVSPHSSCLAFAFSFPRYFTILLSLRVGPSIAVSKMHGPVCDFFLLVSCMTWFLILCYTPSFSRSFDP